MHTFWWDLNCHFFFSNWLREFCFQILWKWLAVEFVLGPRFCKNERKTIAKYSQCLCIEKRVNSSPNTKKSCSLWHVWGLLMTRNAYNRRDNDSSAFIRHWSFFMFSTYSIGFGRFGWFEWKCALTCGCAIFSSSSKLREIRNFWMVRNDLLTKVYESYRI